MASYRVQYTEVVPGDHHYRQDESVRGTLADVRAYLDTRTVWAADPIIVTEHLQSDSAGRIVPASEWDVMDDDD